MSHVIDVLMSLLSARPHLFWNVHCDFAQFSVLSHAVQTMMFRIDCVHFGHLSIAGLPEIFSVSGFRSLKRWGIILSLSHYFLFGNGDLLTHHCSHVVLIFVLLLLFEACLSLMCFTRNRSRHLPSRVRNETCQRKWQQEMWTMGWVYVQL